MPRVLVLVLVLACATTARAQLVVNHGGYLLDALDHPVEGTVGLTFRLHDAPTGGAVVWTGDAAGAPCPVLVRGGYYAVQLGAGAGGCGTGLGPAALPAAADRWLSVTVGNVTLEPRHVLARAPVALTSADAQALTTRLASAGTVNDAENPVDWSQLKGVPADFADGTDDGASYGAGGGLALIGQVFSLADGGVTNDKLEHDSVTVVAGTGLTGGGAVSLGGSVSVALGDTGVVAGTYTNATVSVDSQGRVTSATNGTGGSGGGGGLQAGATLPSTPGAVGTQYLVTSTSQIHLSTGGAWLPYGAPILGTPGSFTALAGNAQVAVSWTAATNATGYEIGRSAGSTFNGATALLTSAAGTSATIAPLTNGQTSAFAVRSVNGDLRSAWSAAQVATPLALGASAGTPAASCAALHTAVPTAISGPYWIDPNGGPTSDSFQAWCDMDTAPGGWTVIMKFGASSGDHMTTGEFGVGTTDKIINPAVVDATVKKISDASIRALYTTEFRWHRSDNAAHVLYFQPQAIGTYATNGLFTQRCRREEGPWSIFYASDLAGGGDFGLTTRANPNYTIYCSYKANPSGNWDGMVAMTYSTNWRDQCGRLPDVPAGYCSPTLNAWVMVR